MPSLVRAFAVALAALLALASPASAAPRAERTLTVFAAASLTDAFRELGAAYQREHPGTRVRFSFAGSQQLASQLEQGAAADVFASADLRWMDEAAAHHLTAEAARVFARNRLVAIVPRTNPGRVDRLRDLARRGLKLVIAADAVPAGHYSREAIECLAREGGYPPDFVRRVLANVVSEEENVRGVVSKVQLGEADAGFCYRSDVSGAMARHVRSFELPDSCDVMAEYRVAPLASSRLADEARAFVALALSPAGQAVLVRHGFLGPAAR